MKMGTIFIFIGVVCIIIGIGIKFNSSEKSQLSESSYKGKEAKSKDEKKPQTVLELVEIQQPQEKRKSTDSSKTSSNTIQVDKGAQEHKQEPENELPPKSKKEKSAKDKGNDFEAYYADIFKFNQIRIKEWNQGTITKEGAMGENALKPDFFVIQKVGDSELEYWVECKWRKSLDSYKRIPEYQYNRYKTIQRESRRKIFIALGIGDTPDKPQAVYVIPLDSLSDGKISEEILSPYRHSDPKMQLSSRIKDYFYSKVFRKKR